MEIYGLLSTVCGWTDDYIDERVTMSVYNRKVEYWSKHPPVHLMVAAYLGFKPPREFSSVEEMAAAFGSATGGTVAKRKFTLDTPPSD